MYIYSQGRIIVVKQNYIIFLMFKLYFLLYFLMYFKQGNLYLNVIINIYYLIEEKYFYMSKLIYYI